MAARHLGVARRFQGVAARMAVVLQTDRAWPDDDIERQVITSAGHIFVAAPANATAETIEALSRAHDPAAIMACWGTVSAAAIAAPSDLKIVQRIGVGLDNIDVAACTDRRAWVANVPDYCVTEVADHAVGLLLDMARGLTRFSRQTRDNIWNPAGAKLRRISTLTVGIVGFGRIGRATAARLIAFGCAVLADDHRQDDMDGVRRMPLDAMLPQCDAIIIHAPLTPMTQHLFDAERIARMKPGAWLINVSRGALVDNQALADALTSGQIGGAGLDVVDGEPATPALFRNHDAVIMTPHIAFSSDASLAELRRRAAEEVVRVLAGEQPHFPCNVIHS